MECKSLLLHSLLLHSWPLESKIIKNINLIYGLGENLPFQMIIALIDEPPVTAIRIVHCIFDQSMPDRICMNVMQPCQI